MSTVLHKRRTRLNIQGSAVGGIVWAIILLGTALTVALTYCFGTENMGARLLLTAITGTSIGLVLFMIVVLDLPFWGAVSIEPESFERVLKTFMRLAHTGG